MAHVGSGKFESGGISSSESCPNHHLALANHSQSASSSSSNTANSSLISEVKPDDTLKNHSEDCSRRTEMESVIPKVRIPVHPLQKPTLTSSKRKISSEESERASWDESDGHYRCIPDDILCGRYKIIKLLGQGTYGRVVECLDRALNRNFAVKIIKSVPKYREAAKTELRVLRAIKENDQDCSSGCIHLLEVFEWRDHVCMVFEKLSVSLFDFLKSNDYQPFPMSQVQLFARQLFESVRFMHSLSLVHTDLKPENVLLISNDSYPVKSRRSKRPVRKASAKSGVIESRILRCTKVQLIDFGSTVFETEHHPSLISTRHYRAPEVVLGVGWSYSCDLWSLGCILSEIATGEALFQTHDNLEHLAMMEKIIGRFPKKLVDKFYEKQRNDSRTSQRHSNNSVLSTSYSHSFSKRAKLLAAEKPIKLNSDDFFKKDSQGKNYKVYFPSSSTKSESKKFVNGLKRLKDFIMKINLSGVNRKTSDEILFQFLDLITCCLEIDPQKRISAADALQHPFFELDIIETYED